MKIIIKKLFVTLILSFSILTSSTWCGYFDDFDDTIGVPKLGIWSLLAFDNDESTSLYSDVFYDYESDEDENSSLQNSKFTSKNIITDEKDASSTFFQKNEQRQINDISTKEDSLQQPSWARFFAITTASGLGLFEVFSFFSR